MYIAGVKRDVDTGDTYFNELGRLPISGAVLARKILIERPLMLQLSILNAKPLEARIEYARWIVDCPNCSNAEFAFEDKLFLCSLCGNSDIEGQLRKVKMPPQRPQIEKLLGKRAINNRHWYPDETIEKLQAENDKEVS